MLYNERTVILDVAHNEQGLTAVLDQIKIDYSTNSNIVIVCGFSKNKDVDKMLSIMEQKGAKLVYPVSCPHFRL